MADSHSRDDGASSTGTSSADASLTLGSLPDELLAVMFGFCDARTRMMAIPAVTKRWLGVCQQMRHATIDLTWAVRDYCAITDTGLARRSGAPVP